MGVRSDGVHVIGVLLTERTRDGKDQMAVVEAVGWAQYSDETGGVHLVLTDVNGEVVERFAPGTYRDVTARVPGVDC